MNELILDIKIAIAEKDADVWWLFYKYFNDFKSYTRQYINHYCQLFTNTIRLNHCTKYYYLISTRCIYGRQEWRLNGKLHRNHGLAIIWPDGDQKWYQNGNLHRNGGPAVIKNGKQEWYQHGIKIDSYFIF